MLVKLLKCVIITMIIISQNSLFQCNTNSNNYLG